MLSSPESANFGSLAKGNAKSNRISNSPISPGHRRNVSDAPIIKLSRPPVRAKAWKRQSQQAPVSLPSIPFTSAEWKKAIAEIKQHHVTRRYRACSARCNEILTNIKNPVSKLCRISPGLTYSGLTANLVGGRTGIPDIYQFLRRNFTRDVCQVSCNCLTLQDQSFTASPRSLRARIHTYTDRRRDRSIKIEIPFCSINVTKPTLTIRICVISRVDSRCRPHDTNLLLVTKVEPTTARVPHQA